MKFFNFRNTLDNILEVLKRFPLSVVFSIIAAVSAITSIHYEHLSEIEHITKFVISGYLGLVSSIGVHLFTENKSNKVKISVLSSFVILMVLYYFNLEVYEYHFYRFGFYLVCSILFLSISTSIFNKNNESFWNFNKITILRLLQSFFFSIILNIGISVAILAMNELFNANWNNRIYPQLFVFILTIFNSFFFLSGIPNNEKSEEKINYANSLRLLASYILIPIAILYAVILYLYFIKIIVVWQIPSGWVSSLVIYYSITGILAYYIIYPILKTGNKLNDIFAKYYFYSLIPAVVLMTLSIVIRIDNYAFTENRLIVIIYNIWLYIITLYFVFFKNRNLKFVPISLLLTSILMVTFPINIMTVSEKSQLNRFEQILKKEKVLDNGKINKEIRPDKETVKDLQSILSYMSSYHRFNLLKKWIVENKFPTDSIKLDSLTEEQANKFFNLNFEFKFSFFQGKAAKQNNINFEEEKDFSYPLSEINGYNYKLNFNFNEYQSDKEYISENYYDNNKFQFKFSNKDTLLLIKSLNYNTETYIKLTPVLVSLHEKINNTSRKFLPADYSIEYKTEKFDYKIVFNSVRWSSNDNYYIDQFNANIYYKINQK